MVRRHEATVEACAHIGIIVYEPVKVSSLGGAVVLNRGGC